MVTPGAPEVTEGAAATDVTTAAVDKPSGETQPVVEQPATVIHQGKTITPLHTSVEKATDPSADEEAESTPGDPPEPTDITPEASNTPPEADAGTGSAMGGEGDEEKSEVEGENVKTAQKTVEEADTKRQQELEELVSEGTYNLPINAVRRKRSRTLFIVFIVLILLAVVTFDLLLDAGLLQLQGIPHTHFLLST